jgi:hypothetical protein
MKPRFPSNPSLFTPFCVENAQMATLPSLINAHKVGIFNEKRCKGGVRGETWFPSIYVKYVKII